MTAPRLDGDCLAEREAFEAWAGTLKSWVPNVQRFHPSGPYRSMVTASAWSGWEARSAFAASNLSNLLARIHRDGGHYEGEHGTAKALHDADLKLSDLLAELDSLRAALSASKQGGKADASLSHSQIIDIGARNSSPEQFGRLFTEAQWFAAVRQIEAALQPQGDKSHE